MAVACVRQAVKIQYVMPVRDEFSDEIGAYKPASTRYQNPLRATKAISHHIINPLKTAQAETIQTGTQSFYHRSEFRRASSPDSLELESCQASQPWIDDIPSVKHKGRLLHQGLDFW